MGIRSYVNSLKDNDWQNIKYDHAPSEDESQE